MGDGELAGTRGGFVGDSRGTRWGFSGDSRAFRGTRSENDAEFHRFQGDSSETTVAFYNIKKGELMWWCFLVFSSVCGIAHVLKIYAPRVAYFAFLCSRRSGLHAGRGAEVNYNE